jgi:MFS family permease
VTLRVLSTALDGFDVLSISFAAPGVAGDWGVDRAALGTVLSIELIGMAVGTILIGAVAAGFFTNAGVLGILHWLIQAPVKSH